MRFLFLFLSLSVGLRADFDLSTLTLEEKVAQLCFVAAAIDEEVDKELVENWEAWQPLYKIDRASVEKMIIEQKVGGVVFYGDKATSQSLLKIVRDYQSISQIPLMFCLDAETGVASRVTDLEAFPMNHELGSIDDLALVYQTGYEVGKQLKHFGIHVNFAPVVDVNNNPDNPIIGTRSFGSDPVEVAKRGVAYMQGLQEAGIIACAKHFPGHGDVSVDSHMELPFIPHSLEHLQQIELFPFKKMIEAGIYSVMTAFLEIPALEKEPGLPVALSRQAVTELLKNELGFKGLVFTDALGMKGVLDRFEPGEAELRALIAGNDVLLCPVDVEKVIKRVVSAVKNGEITESQIDQKVLKVFQAKKWAIDQSKSLEYDEESTNAFIKELFERIDVSEQLVCD